MCRACSHEGRNVLFAAGPTDEQRGRALRIDVRRDRRGKSSGFACDRFERLARGRVERRVAEREPRTEPFTQLIGRVAQQVREPDAHNPGEQPEGDAE